MIKTLLYPFLIFLFTLLLWGLAGCGGPSEKAERVSPPKKLPPVDQEEDLPIIVFLGDSLTEGYRVGLEENYPTRVGEKLAEKGIRLEVVNGGLSGDTTAGGLERVDWFLKLQPTYLFLALGANDGLRGLKLEQTYNNLKEIIERSQKQGIQVLLAGLKLPPNYGKDYTEEFEDIFLRLSKTYSLPLYPFLLESVAGEPELNLEDGIHPNPKGYEIISSGVAEFIANNL